VAGLVTKTGQLVEEGSYAPLTRTNIDDGYLSVDVHGDLWRRYIDRKSYSAAAYRRFKKRVERKFQKLSPRGYNNKLKVGFGSDDALDRLDLLAFDEAHIRSRKADPYWQSDGQIAA
jgi:hypothetical protein